MGNKKARQYQKQSEEAEAWHIARFEPRQIETDVDVPGIGLRRVQLVYAPSFDPGYSWDIRQLVDSFRLYRSHVSVADRDYVLKGYRQLDIPSDVLKQYFADLKSLTLSVEPVLNGMMGLDGPSYQLAIFGDMSSSVRFTWWSNPPSQWRRMADIAEYMIETFRGVKEIPIKET